MGAILGGLLAGVVLRVSNWRVLLRIASSFLGITGALMALILRDGDHGRLPGAVESPEPGRTDAGLVKIRRTKSFSQAMSSLAGSVRVMLCFATTMTMMPLNELNSLVPLYLVQNCGLSLGSAAALGTAYPVGAVVSMLVTGGLFGRMKDSGRAKMFAIQNCLSLAGLQVLAMTPTNSGVVVAALVTTMVGAAPMIFLAPGALIARFASSKYNGTLVGLNDAPGFLMSMLVLKYYPAMLSRGGWAMPMKLMQAFVLIGGLCNWTVWRMEAENPTVSPIV